MRPVRELCRACQPSPAPDPPLPYDLAGAALGGDMRGALSAAAASSYSRAASARFSSGLIFLISLCRARSLTTWFQ